jgi:hypothetical protein
MPADPQDSRSMNVSEPVARPLEELVRAKAQDVQAPSRWHPPEGGPHSIRPAH